MGRPHTVRSWPIPIAVSLWRRKSRISDQRRICWCCRSCPLPLTTTRTRNSHKLTHMLFGVNAQYAFIVDLEYWWILRHWNYYTIPKHLFIRICGIWYVWNTFLGIMRNLVIKRFTLLIEWKGFCDDQVWDLHFNTHYLRKHSLKCVN